jgi:hypothetical protein
MYCVEEIVSCHLALYNQPTSQYVYGEPFPKITPHGTTMDNFLYITDLLEISAIRYSLLDVHSLFLAACRVPTEIHIWIYGSSNPFSWTLIYSEKTTEKSFIPRIIFLAAWRLWGIGSWTDGQFATSNYNDLFHIHSLCNINFMDLKNKRKLLFVKYCIICHVVASLMNSDILYHIIHIYIMPVCFGAFVVEVRRVHKSKFVCNQLTILFSSGFFFCTNHAWEKHIT